MDTKNNTKKGKKILWLSIFLIVAVVIVSFVIHLRINGYLLKQETRDIINKYKETIIESVQIPAIMNPINNIEQLERDTKQILELQNSIKELQKKLDNSNSSTVNYTQSIKLIVSSSLLSNKLQNGKPFLTEIEDLLKTYPKAILKTKLDKIKPYANQGIRTQEDLIKDYQKVYQQTYSAYLKTDTSIISKIKSYLLYLVFVKKNNTVLLTDDTSVINKLANVETYMRLNNFKTAYNEFLQIEIEPSSNTKKWISAMQERIEANEVLKEITIELNNYLNLGSK